MANVVRAALVQSEWTGDKQSMIDKNIEYARQAAAQGAQILCFQEIFNTPYFCTRQENEHFATAEPIPDGPTVSRMMELARETGMVLIVPIFEVEDTGHYYNAAAVIDSDGTYLGKYRKTHIPQVAGFWEKFYFRPGNLGYPVFDTSVGRIGGLHLLRPPLPRGLAGVGPGRGQDRLQPVRDHAGALQVPVGTGTARSRGGQRVLRRGHQPGGQRGIGGHRLLREFVLRVAPGRDHRRDRFRHRGRRGGPGLGSRPDRGGPASLGFLPGPASGDLREDRDSLAPRDTLFVALQSGVSPAVEGSVSADHSAGLPEYSPVASTSVFQRSGYGLAQGSLPTHVHQGIDHGHTVAFSGQARIVLPGFVN